MRFKETFDRIGTGELLATNFKGALCFWLITTGRSGSMTFAKLMDATNTITAVHEPWPILTHEGKLWITGHPLSTDAARRMLHVARGTYVENAYVRKGYYFDCSLFMSHMAHMILSAFCESRFVHLIRKPREFVCSALGKGWYNRATNQTYLWPTPPDGMGPPEALCWLWNRVHTRGLELEEAWGERRVHRLYSDDLFKGDEAVEKLLHWMGLTDEVVPRMRGAAWTALRKDTSTRNEAHDKPDWDPQWEDLLKKNAGDTMEKLGME